MSTFKNVYNMPIHIPFGDFEPSTTFHYDAISRCLTINDEDYGIFSQEGFNKIMRAWESFNEEYYFDYNVCRWRQF